MKTRVLFVIAALGLNLALTACAMDQVDDNGTPMRLGNNPDTVSLSHADGAAYVADAMTVDKWEPIRPANDDVFYFKTCNQIDDKTFYSMTSYDCTVP